ncbi:P-loop NTPase family protein [Candidatus Venteria ishoeyi]|uniref:hypothetical protein n=1 Tax=Candidatus Venteria ishoeyi TaxID=1899563 RepID=UPI0011B08193|nr:hypothetical protein [Candidatus Venteria ishoeyi]
MPNLIERGDYFVIHAARQSGKTTLLMDLVKQLNDSGLYHVLYCSLESVQNIADVERGIPAVVQELNSQVQFNPALRDIPFAEKTSEFDFNTLLRMSLSYFCQKLDKPLIILFIDSLIGCLKEKRVQRIVEPVILGRAEGYAWGDDDYQYVLDLGLLRESEGKLIPANPIYSEVIIRALASASQMEMSRRAYPPQMPAYLSDGKLNMRRLLEDFQYFWQQHSESWVARYQYQEAAPHLILHAFLYRIVNGGGRISREMAAGNGRLGGCPRTEAVAREGWFEADFFII